MGESIALFYKSPQSLITQFLFQDIVDVPYYSKPIERQCSV